MGPTGNLFYAKLQFPKGGLEREEQGRASEHIGLGWIDQSKENHIVAEWVDKRKSRILDQIGDMEEAGVEPEEAEEAE